MTEEELAAIAARAERTRAIRAPGYPLTPAEADREALLTEVTRLGEAVQRLTTAVVWHIAERDRGR